MKSKLLAITLSMLGMSFLAANGTVDAKNDKSMLATGAAVEVKTEVTTDAAKKEVAAEEVAKAEVAKAKKAEETKTAQEKSCAECK